MDWLKEILINNNSNEEIEKKIIEKIEENFIPKEQYEVGENEIKKINGNNEVEIDEDLKKYEDQICELKEKLKQQEVNFEIEKAIIQAKGRNVKSIMALIDKEKIYIDENGKLKGFDLEEIKNSDGYLFETEQKSKKGTGISQGMNRGNNEVARQFERALFR